MYPQIGMQPLPELSETEAIEPRLKYALLGVPFVAIGIFLAASAYFSGTRQIAGSVTQFVVPGGVILDLQPAQTYTLFQEKGATIKGKSYSNWPQLNSMTCTLTKAYGGQAVDLRSPQSKTTYTAGARQGAALYDFVVPTSGQYDFTCEKRGDTPVLEGVVAIGAGVGENMSKMLAHCYTSLLIGCGLGVLISLIVLVQRELSKRRIRAEGLRPI